MKLGKNGTALNCNFHLVHTPAQNREIQLLQTGQAVSQGIARAVRHFCCYHSGVDYQHFIRSQWANHPQGFSIPPFGRG